jgi:hypothetical protein
MDEIAAESPEMPGRRWAHALQHAQTGDESVERKTGG